VTGYPFPRGDTCVGFLGAGSREARHNRERDGGMRFIDPPVLNAYGKPIIDKMTGRGIDFTIPASRSVQLFGKPEAVARLRALAERGGRLAMHSRDKTLRLLAGWQFGSPEELWWALVFELAWSGRHPGLSASRHLWQERDDGARVTFPYDIDQVRRFAELGVNAAGILVPESWLKRLPEAYVSEIEDAASACFDLAGILADELETALTGGIPETTTREIASSPHSAAPDDRGYVATPSDPSAYVPASDIVSKHAPAALCLTIKQLTQILEDYPTNRIRWTRPPGKKGNPRPNRRSVHLADFFDYVERRRAGGAADDKNWPTVLVYCL